jgi:hypothetical protein
MAGMPKVAAEPMQPTTDEEVRLEEVRLESAGKPDVR